MKSEHFDVEKITEDRLKSIQETIRPINMDELKALGEGLFPYVDHPWRDVFFNFIAENSSSTFYHATTNDHVHIIYCGTKDKGMWFLPGSGMGPLQEKGLKMMKEIVSGHTS